MAAKVMEGGVEAEMMLSLHGRKYEDQKSITTSWLDVSVGDILRVGSRTRTMPVT